MRASPVRTLKGANGRQVYGYLEDCALCGVEQPAAHVVIHDRGGSRVGRVCASHTLAEIVLDLRERFIVDILPVGTAAVEALEAAKRRAWERNQKKGHTR